MNSVAYTGWAAVNSGCCGTCSTCDPDCLGADVGSAQAASTAAPMADSLSNRLMDDLLGRGDGAGTEWADLRLYYAGFGL